MKIETKYDVGERIWIIDRGGSESSGEVMVYSDVIAGINIDKDGITYWSSESYDEVKEDEVIPYSDTQKLLEIILEIDREIAENEKKKKEEK